jgi:hypothetical protein
MKYLALFLLATVVNYSCNSGGKVGSKDSAKVVVTHYPKIVYNSCVDEYAVETDSQQFFGKVPPLRISPTFSIVTGGTLTLSGSSGYSIYDGPPPPQPPPALITINWLHDTLKFTWLGGEFQFKDSVTALASYTAFLKECKDTEDIQNVPIRIKLKHYWDSAHAKQYKDSIAGRKQFIFDSTAKANAHIEDSIFKCHHTYTSN